MRPALTATAVVVILAGCGGASATKQAERLCARDAVRMRAASDYQHKIAVARRELRELRALHAAKLAPLVGALQREADMADRLRVAGMIGDTESAEGAYHLGQVAAADARRAARTLGVVGCG